MAAMTFSEILVVQDAEEYEKDDHEQEENHHSNRDKLTVKRERLPSVIGLCASRRRGSE